MLALTASPAARDYAAHHPYADAGGHLNSARTTLGNKPLDLPLGSLIVVDDADHLSAHNLCWLTNAAGNSNTKLILITTTDPQHEPAHTLLTALQQNCLTFHELGTPDSHRKPQPRTAIERVEHHLATTNTPHATHSQATELLHSQAVELLHQRTQLMHRLRDIADAAASLDNLAVRSRHRSYGLDIGM